MSGNSERQDSIYCYCCGNISVYYTMYNRQSSLLGWVNMPKNLADVDIGRINPKGESWFNARAVKEALASVSYFECDGCKRVVVVESFKGQALMRYGQKYVVYLREGEYY